MARTPKYKAAETEMIARITSGAWEVGRRLPNEFQLADEFGVSQGTMRRALISLEGVGYLSRKPGRGTLVAMQAPQEGGGAVMNPHLLDAHGTPLQLAPFRGRTGTRATTPSEDDLLGTAKVVFLERTLKHAGQRAALEELIMPDGALSATLSEDAPANLLSHLEELGHAPARLEARATAQVTDMAQSVALSTDRYAALLCVHTTAFDASGKAIAVQLLKLSVPGAQLVHT